MNFNGQTAMITGASVGIGRATALQMAKDGANLVLLDINEEKLAHLCDELKEYNIKVESFICDVSNEQQVNEVTGKAIDIFGKIDILVNNAAIWKYQADFIDMTTADWQLFINVNVMGVVFCTKAVLGSMIKNNYGRIVNVASVAGIYGNGTMAPYSATKGAVIAMTKALAKEVANKGITVNCTAPGTVSSSEDEDIDAYTPSDVNYMNRTGTDRENADLICFLASDKASYITGQTVQIDGCRRKL